MCEQDDFIDRSESTSTTTSGHIFGVVTCLVGLIILFLAVGLVMAGTYGLLLVMDALSGGSD